MSTILDETRRRLSYLIEENNAEITYPEQWHEAAGYAPWVEEVWANYISNAIKYGGRPPKLELGSMPQSDDFVCFWVRDNGAGIAQQDKSRLFTPFERLNPAKVEGHGLGLSVVQRIVKKLGGSVGVESEIGRGSIFYFTLPRSA